MDQLIVIIVNTLIIPFLVAAAKKIFRTDKLSDDAKKTIHTILPLATGILTSGLVSYQHTHDWKLALAVGLGSGGAASSLRDADKQLNFMGGLRTMVQNPKEDPPQA